jgi:Fusaric acid resistance protein-like
MRFFALAAAAATGLRFSDPHVLLSVACGGASAFASAYLTWRCFGTPPCDNVMDWRSGVRRAFQGAGAEIRFALCYSAAAGVALFAPSRLGIKHSFWATLVILMVMRREGTASFRLTLHYALGTVLGVLVAGVFLRFADTPPTFAVLATAVAVFSRVGFAINPSLGYMSFTMFALAGVHLIAAHGTLPPHLLKTRLYDVTIGCILALVGTLAATYPRRMQAEAATGRNAPHGSVLEALRPANHISGSRALGDHRNPQTRSSCSLVDYASRYLR